MIIKDVAPRVWEALQELRVDHVGTHGLTVRMNPRDWRDLRFQARGVLAHSAPVIEGDTIFGIPVEPSSWVPLGRIFICREVEA